ncbi:MAG: gluconokinase, GntK/IdnK-type [Pseudomonadota bacterium]
MEQPSPILIVVMGVSGCGKSTVGRKLAEHYGAVFLDADDFHPQANIRKMSSGTPLTDQDRVGWVKIMQDGVSRYPTRLVVLACSALTKAVQDGLARLPRQITYVHLNTDNVDMEGRLSQRDHFMPASLLDSQYDALNVPEDAVEFDASLPITDLVARISNTLRPIIPEPDLQS